MIERWVLWRTTTTFSTAVLENLNCSVEPITFRNQKGDNLVYWHERYPITIMLESGNIRGGSGPSKSRVVRRVFILKDNLRLCDVCGEVIPKGQQYAVTLIPKEKVPLAESAFATSPDTAPTRTVDANGNLRQDICLDCKLNTGTAGETIH